MVGTHRALALIQDIANETEASTAVLVLKRNFINEYPLTDFTIEVVQVFNGQDYEDLVKVSVACTDMNEQIRLAQNNIENKLSMILTPSPNPFKKLGKTVFNLNNFDTLAKKMLKKETYNNIKAKYPNDFKVQSTTTNYAQPPQYKL